MIRLVVRLVVWVLVSSAAGLAVPATASAATCGTASGVTVVVDFHRLGGGAQSACDLHGGGGTAATQFTDVGHTLTYAQRQPGFVCRVDGSPSSDPCINTSPADAYWSLWWSDGKSGQWSFSSQGVGSLTVPEGGYVALSWQGGDSKAVPRVAPKPHATASPSPTSHPSTAPPASPSSGSTTPTPSSSSATSSATPLGHHQGGGHHRRGHHDPAATPAATAHADAAPGTTPAEPTGSGLPGWVAPGLVALVFASAAAVFVVRRKRPGGP